MRRSKSSALAADALRVLEGRRDLVVRVLRDALGVGDGLVVQQQELLLRVVLAAGQRLLELECPHPQLADGLFGLGAGERRLARDHRAQRRSALLGLAADGRRLLLGLRDLLGGVGGLALEERLMSGELGVDAQPGLLCVVAAPAARIDSAST